MSRDILKKIIWISSIFDKLHPKKLPRHLATPNLAEIFEIFYLFPKYSHVIYQFFANFKQISIRFITNAKNDITMKNRLKCTKEFSNFIWWTDRSTDKTLMMPVYTSWHLPDVVMLTLYCTQLPYGNPHFKSSWRRSRIIIDYFIINFLFFLA